ncbi:hypothetical protein AJ79_09352 [Helicocarpus griseus UAMH5409]|uniref:C6 finger domain transcription factor nscR n=1 Tax=Helicocarpus griseus UAMH5409 TaxID=1447875 RepID=A0A2B7WKK6_9EURO|nr:hypothetical protein AJ79_09352 [Helicocarpus griseus UAMH5409]
MADSAQGCAVLPTPSPRSLQSLPQHTPSEPRKRGRQATACFQCHVRKQKCSEERPCLHCLRRGVPDLCVRREGVQVHDFKPKRRRKTKESPVTTSKLPPLLQASSNDASVPVQTRQQPEESPYSVESDVEESVTSPRVGQLWETRGAPSFFGNSYFGPQVAATMIDAPAPDIPTGANPSRRSSIARPFRDESGPFSQLWDLLGLLPRRKSTIDRLVDLFLTDINWKIDAVHPQTFRQSYVKFWKRKSGFDDVTTVDLRWLALLFIILAIAVMLDCPQRCSPELQRECEESSLRFYWAARRAVVIAPSFYGESTDLVRAGVLITRYLIHSRRLSESWLTVGFASRIAMAQGIHVDGVRWGLPRKSTETRRRLWCHLYSLDRMIALALGRPYSISDAQCLTEEPENVWVDDMTDQDALQAVSQSLDDPTPAVLSFYSYRLSKIIGSIQEQCFGNYSASYDKVVALDCELVAWRDSLPPYFWLQGPDLSLDATHSFLQWHRLYLHTNYHFARITLHRPYLLRSSITNRFERSREACLSSACADLKTRLEHRVVDSNENFVWSLGAHQLFNSGIVLGIMAVRDPYSSRTAAILEDLEAYCEKQNSDIWVNEFGLAETRVIELCIAKVKQKRKDLAASQQQSSVPASTSLESGQVEGASSQQLPNGNVNGQSAEYQPALLVAPDEQYGIPQADGDSVHFDSVWPAVWQDQSFSFPGAADLETWQEMINTIGTHT